MCACVCACMHTCVNVYMYAYTCAACVHVHYIINVAEFSPTWFAEELRCHKITKWQHTTCQNYLSFLFLLSTVFVQSSYLRETVTAIVGYM